MCRNETITNLHRLLEIPNHHLDLTNSVQCTNDDDNRNTRTPRGFTATDELHLECVGVPAVRTFRTVQYCLDWHKRSHLAHT